MCVCVCDCLVNAVKKETDQFLERKDEWKKEIDARLKELKNMETVLYGRELEIRKVCVCVYMCVCMCVCVCMCKLLFLLFSSS